MSTRLDQRVARSSREVIVPVPFAILGRGRGSAMMAQESGVARTRVSSFNFAELGSPNVKQPQALGSPDTHKQPFRLRSSYLGRLSRFATVTPLTSRPSTACDTSGRSYDQASENIRAAPQSCINR